MSEAHFSVLFILMHRSLFFFVCVCVCYQVAECFMFRLQILFRCLTVWRMCVPIGPICEQYLGVWEGNVSHQPLCTVLLSACLHSDAHGHLTGQTTGL